MNRQTEQQIYEAADAAITRADALTFAAVGRAKTDVAFVNQWTADAEAAEACLRASKVGPASYRVQYAAAAQQFAAYSA